MYSFQKLFHKKDFLSDFKKIERLFEKTKNRQRKFQKKFQSLKLIQESKKKKLKIKKLQNKDKKSS